MHYTTKPRKQKILTLSLMVGIIAITPILVGSNIKIVKAQQNVVHSSFSRTFCCLNYVACLRQSPNSDYIYSDAYLTISGSITQVGSSKFIFQEEVTGYLIDQSTGQKVGTVSGFQTSTHTINGLPATFTNALILTCQGSGTTTVGVNSFFNTVVHVTVDETGQVHDVVVTI